MTSKPQKTSETAESGKVLSEGQLLDVLTEEIEALAALLSEIVNDDTPLAETDCKRDGAKKP